MRHSVFYFIQYEQSDENFPLFPPTGKLTSNVGDSNSVFA